MNINMITNYFHEKKDINNLIELYKHGLLNDTVPFWMNNCIDNVYGGFNFCLDRKGNVIDNDKGIWTQGRFTWLLSTLYLTVEKREEWLSTAKHGIDFIKKYGFDSDGKMFFSVTQDGKPLRKRRYIFSETFTIVAFAAYSKAADDKKIAKEAFDLFKKVLWYLSEPGLLEPKINPSTRTMKGLAVPMILIVTAQILRESNIESDFCTNIIDQMIKEIHDDFMKEEFKGVLESVTNEGEIIDNFDGRMMCPGHSLEAAWFIIQESKFRNNDEKLLKIGLKILDWMLDWGWDKEFGGIYYYRDMKNHPIQEYWHDMKFWWPHNEAIIATLLAYIVTKDDKYANWHKLIHDWSYKHFPDKEYGEWFGYLHRDGRISVDLKGNMWKGPFHLPRMQLVCWKLLEEYI